MGVESRKPRRGMYKSIQDALAGQLPMDAASLTRAHLLLRQHGKETCKTSGPACGECCVVDLCKYAAATKPTLPQ